MNESKVRRLEWILVGVICILAKNIIYNIDV